MGLAIQVVVYLHEAELPNAGKILPKDRALLEGNIVQSHILEQLS